MSSVNLQPLSAFLVRPCGGLQFPREAALPFSAASGGLAQPATPSIRHCSSSHRTPCGCPALWLPHRLLLPLLPPEAESLPFSRAALHGPLHQDPAQPSPVPRSVLSLQPCLPFSLGSQPAEAFSMPRDRCTRKRKKTSVIGGQDNLG